MDNESDWIYMDLEQLVLGGITDTQGSVLRKTSEAFTKAIAQQSPSKTTPANNEG